MVSVWVFTHRRWLGSADVALLTAWLQRPEVTAALNSVTLDSTGVPFDNWADKEKRHAMGPRTYTLTTGDEKIDLSQKNLGSAYAMLRPRTRNRELRCY
jgi:hypothetical protein